MLLHLSLVYPCDYKLILLIFTDMYSNLRVLRTSEIFCSHEFPGTLWTFLIRIWSGLACLCQNQTYFKLLDSVCLPIFYIFPKSLLGDRHQLQAGLLMDLGSGSVLLRIAWHQYGGLQKYFYIALNGPAASIKTKKLAALLNLYSAWWSCGKISNKSL